MTTHALRSEAATRLDGVRVLIAEDALDVRQAVTDTLESAGAAVTAVGSAEAALVALQSERPGVLVSDLSMPGKGGDWLIGQVRALSPERGGAPPAAAVTDLIGPQHRASVLSAVFQYHVEKPLGPCELVGIVAILALKDEM
jgi:two-component system, chemotaxis family, CheB/CheR fusion protein